MRQLSEGRREPSARFPDGEGTRQEAVGAVFWKSFFVDNFFEKNRKHAIVLLVADQRAPVAPRAAAALSLQAGELTRSTTARGAKS
jgi:hypothetical protein